MTRLEALRALEVAASAWDRHDRSPTYLTHVDKRLPEAHALASNPRFKERLGPVAVAYLDAAQKAARLSRAKARRMKIAVVALAVMLAGAGVGWWKQDLLKEQYHWRMVMGPSVLTAEQEKDKAAKPGSDFKECANACPRMIVIPAGGSLMGDKGAQHEVTLAKAVAVGKFDVTFDEWDQCTAAGACPRASDRGWGRGNRPVINVSWHDAKAYVGWLSRLTGKDYRLLSEVEFEYAARGSTTTEYPWGDEIGQGNANCVGCGSKWDGKKTAPVGSFKPNAFGLYDMHGNVWKWCEDGWHSDFPGAPTDGSPWLDGGDASRRVVRGGSWDDIPQFLRSAIRDGINTDLRNYYLGFRVARTLHP